MKQKSKANKPSQSARFIEAASKAGVDESGKEFERALGMLLPPRKKPKKKH
jgi:hypothetical protein